MEGTEAQGGAAPARDRAAWVERLRLVWSAAHRALLVERDRWFLWLPVITASYLVFNGLALA